jgi:hypothetical protein
MVWRWVVEVRPRGREAGSLAVGVGVVGCMACRCWVVGHLSHIRTEFESMNGNTDQPCRNVDLGSGSPVQEAGHRHSRTMVDSGDHTVAQTVPSISLAELHSLVWL